MRRKKIFLAGPFKTLVNPKTNMMDKNSIYLFSSIIDYFETNGWEVHCAHKRESWGRDFMKPTQCTRIDFEEIRKCDYFVAFPGYPASPGTHIEIGWASAMKKPVVLLLEEGKKYAYLVQGISSVTSVKFVYFRENIINPLEIESAIKSLSTERLASGYV